jgi:Glycosyl transferase family 11
MIVIVPCGGLGNLLFQHAAAWSHAKEQGQELAALGWYPDVYTVRPKFGEYSRLFKHVKILGNPEYCIKTPEWHYDPDRSDLMKAAILSGETRVLKESSSRHSLIPPDARILQGFFQSWKYFDKYRTEIRDLLQSNESEMWSERKGRYRGSVCVHVRWGGDGKLVPHIHPVCSKEYYENAMKLFPGKKFLIFCEEPELVGDWAGPMIEIMNEPNPLKTFFLMSACEHFIIANSSLSLMAYYMRINEDARLVAPSNWFGPGGRDFDIYDFIKYSDNVTLLTA